MPIVATPARLVDAFCQPASLRLFWLSRASAPLQVGKTVRWTFMVEGAEVETTATRIEDRAIAWDWSDGSTVRIDLEPFGDATAVTLVNEGFKGDREEQVARALDATEGFAIVLCDLKTLLENGRSAGLTRGKADLIAARS